LSQQINLFNPALLKQTPVFTAATMARSLGLLLAGVLVIAFYARHSMKRMELEAAAGEERLNQAKVRQAAVLGEFAPKQKSKDIEAQIAAARATLQALHDIEATLKRGELGDTAGYAGYFKALARQSSGTLWLTGVSINGAGRQIGLQGRALEADLVPAYITRLTREPVMQGKTFGSLSINRAQLKDAAKPDSVATDAPYIDFSLQAQAAGEGK